ncbi:hypothetical protein L6164_017637 [Bauhinia variegata]|uniref:Uncharacterized protein n=1 Tax=Bauhinia variegata TaxID=167791 RepID=A0ACB9N8J6_BAUVA|nr:hypothetical protein L6164_017637 [Bauhinia variegata]
MFCRALSWRIWGIVGSLWKSSSNDKHENVGLDTVGTEALSAMIFIEEEMILSFYSVVQWKDVLYIIDQVKVHIILLEIVSGVPEEPSIKREILLKLEALLHGWSAELSCLLS